MCDLAGAGRVDPWLIYHVAIGHVAIGLVAIGLVGRAVRTGGGAAPLPDRPGSDGGAST